MRYNFITIEGNIGAGKTSLARRLTEDFNGKLILEAFADNPFLPKFYRSGAYLTAFDSRLAKTNSSAPESP